MAEDEVKPAVRFYCVCGHCNHHDKSPGLEFNFRENAIYYLCSECKKMNKMEVAPFLMKPYPKSRTGVR